MIIKIENASDETLGTSFFNETIKTNVQKLREVLGEETYHDVDIKEKVQYDWQCFYIDKKGKKIPFTIYDWKEYRTFGINEEIEFHIGRFGDCDVISDIIKELEEMLK